MFPSPTPSIYLAIDNANSPSLSLFASKMYFRYPAWPRPLPFRCTDLRNVCVLFAPFLPSSNVFRPRSWNNLLTVDLSRRTSCRKSFLSQKFRLNFLNTVYTRDRSLSLSSIDPRIREIVEEIFIIFCTSRAASLYSFTMTNSWGNKKRNFHQVEENCKF